jgi:hypothetical protein
MTSLIPLRKEVSVVHLNSDWGYLAYIEKFLDRGGEPRYRVVRVPLEDGFGEKKANKSAK